MHFIGIKLWVLQRNVIKTNVRILFEIVHSMFQFCTFMIYHLAFIIVIVLNFHNKNYAAPLVSNIIQLYMLYKDKESCTIPRIIFHIEILESMS